MFVRFYFAGTSTLARFAGEVFAAGFGAPSLRTLPQGSSDPVRNIAERPLVGPLGLLVGLDLRRRLCLVGVAILLVGGDGFEPPTLSV